LAVDTFFFIGGFLLGYGFFKSARRQPFDALKFYFYRYLRYVRVALTLGLHSSLARILQTDGAFGGDDRISTDRDQSPGQWTCLVHIHWTAIRWILL